MSHPVVEVQNVSKKYVIHHQFIRHGTLRDALIGGVRRLVGQRPADEPRREEFWALKDVSFTINQGDRVGIVGRNGAGKSTLLKLLSRITTPTEGRIRLRGRVSSLLEVGTGFHPDLTGRENIYMNGAILGMTRAEIRRKFDEIVAFADVAKFLDTPVKRYSSGMAVRLAFAVAAHLEPEILIVDEVLSVGDAEFQKKCIGKMQDVSRGQGRTVFFVSHSMAAVQALCSKGVFLTRGKLTHIGPVDEIVDLYIKAGASCRISEAREEGADFELLRVDAGTPDHAPLETFKPAAIEVVFRPKRPISDASAHVLIEDLNGSPVLGLDTKDLAEKRSARKGEEVVCRFDIENLPLTPGPFRMRLFLKSHEESLIWEVPRVIELTVEGGAIYGARPIDRQWHGTTGVVARAAVATQ